MALHFLPNKMQAGFYTPREEGFSEDELTQLIAPTRLYFDLSDEIILIVSAYAHALQERFNILATRALNQNHAYDMSIYGPALLVQKSELSKHVQTTLHLQGIGLYE